MKSERTPLYQEIVTLANPVEPIKGYDTQAGIVYTIQRIPALEVVLDGEIPITGFRITETRAAGEKKIFLCATAGVMREVLYSDFSLGYWLPWPQWSKPP